jgi:tetratricopeptide (TPR) repeat protein
LRDWFQGEFSDRDLRTFPKLEQQLELGWREWRQICGGRSALIIIDDVTDYRAQVQPYLPPPDQASPFQFLLTSRKVWDGISCLPLSQLELGAAVDLLGQGAKRQWSESERVRAEGLCGRLGCLPLAIVLVGSWIGLEPERDLELAIEALTSRGLQSPAMEPNALSVNIVAERGVNAAFRLSWDQLAEANPEAQMLARVLVLFAPMDLDWQWVEAVILAYERWLQEATVAARPERVGCLGRLLGWRGRSHGVEVEPKTVVEGIGEPVEARAALVGLSLWQRVQPGWFRLHPLLREFFSDQWQGYDYWGWLIAYCRTISDLAGTVPADIDWERAAQFHALRPQFEQALGQLPKLAWNCDDLDVAKVYKAQAQTIQVAQFRLAAPVLFELTFERGRKAHEEAKACGNPKMATRLYGEALADYQKAVDQARQALPQGSLQLAGYLYYLADLLEDLGRYQVAIPAMEEAMEIAKTKATPRTISNCLNLLASLYKSQGYYEAAEPLFRQSLELRKHLLGEEHSDVAASLNNLALLYWSQGRYEAAEPLHRQSLELKKHVLGEEHPDVAVSLNNLAALYKDQGRYEAAEPLYHQSLELRKRLLGEEHPDVAASLHNLAALYNDQGRYKDAEPLYHQSLKLLKRLLGEEHPDVATSLNNLALLYCSQGRYEAAEPLYHQSLELLKHVLGEEHPHVAASLHNLAALYCSQDRYEAAETLYFQALAIATTHLGQDHPDTQTMLNNFALFLRKAITNHQTHRLSDHPATQTLLARLQNPD